MTLDDIKEQIAAQMEEVELLDFLNISMYDLVEILSEQIDERKEEFRASLGL